MRKFAMAAMLMSSSVFASSELQNLMYLPKTGTLWGQSTLTRFSDSYDTQTRTNKVKQSEVDESYWALRQGFYFGVLDELEVGAELGLLFGGSVETKSLSTNSTTEKKYSGFEDLNFTARYRLLNQRDMGMNVDVVGSLSPSLSDDKEATTTTDGNAQRGGHRIVVGGKVGSSVDNFSWVAHLNLIWTGEITEQNAQTEVEQGTYDSNISFDLGIKGQLEMDPLTFGAKLGFMSYGSTDYTLKSSGAKTAYDSYTSFVIGADASMALLDNLVGFGGLDYAFVGDRGFTAANVEYDIAERSQFIFTIGAKYSF